MHLAYIICSFNVGSSGLMPGAAIFGTKNLHHGTIVYLPYVPDCSLSQRSSGPGTDCNIAHYRVYHQQEQVWIAFQARLKARRNHHVAHLTATSRYTQPHA